MMDSNENLAEFEWKKSVQEKLRNQELLHRELESGRTGQEILEFSDETMAKFYHAARLLLEQKEYEEAENAFFFLTTLSPNHHEYWLGLGMATQMCGKLEEAVDAYELAAHKRVDSPVPYFYLGKCLYALHERSAALDALELAIEYAGDLPEYATLKNQAQAARELIEG